MREWIKEGKLAVNWTRLSSHKLQPDEVRCVPTYNLWRRLELPQKIKRRSLTSSQQRWSRPADEC